MTDNQFYVYVLKSLRNGKRYVGYTGTSPQQRLEEHNSKKQTSYDKGNAPFVLIYTELLDTRSDAMKREKFLKSGQGRKWLDENIV